jgi:hypothetical protein
MGPRLRAGRFFGPADHSGGPPAAVVSEAFAASFFGTIPTVGSHVLVGGEEHEVVGVVEDAPVERLHEAP